MEPTQRSALARLLNGLKREQHDYRPSLEVFPALNIEKLAADMGLATAGAERGTREEPAAGSIALDDVENRIIERVEAEKNAAHGLLLDELRTYKERLSSLDFEGRFATIRQGVSLVALKEESDSFAKMQRLLKDGVDADKIARGMALASAIDQAGSAKSGPKLTPEQVVTLIEKGIAASKLQRANEGGRGQHNWPPIINLSEAGGYYFASGSAVLTPDFAAALRNVVITRLLDIADSFDVDVIEVIGHTDEQPVANHASNLDRYLSSVTLAGTDAAVLQWSDNAGLGLARALAVVKVLASDARLAAFRTLPLSGAQLIDTDGRLTRWEGGDVRERRRIEIRMRKSN